MIIYVMFCGMVTVKHSSLLNRLLILKLTLGLHTHLTHSCKLTLCLSILALQFLTFAIYFHHASYTLLEKYFLKLLQKYIQLQRHHFISSAISLVENILSVTQPDWDIFTKVNVLHQNPINYSNICFFFFFLTLRSLLWNNVSESDQSNCRSSATDGEFWWALTVVSDRSFAALNMSQMFSVTHILM